MSSGNPIDPCRQWLGISALDLDDPRKLLGLESVDDPIRILQAAEARIVRLQGVEAGPFEVARRALVARIEEARDALLASMKASGPPAPPSTAEGLAMPRSPTAVADDSVEKPPPLPGAMQSFPYPSPYPPPPGPGMIPGSPAPIHPLEGQPLEGQPLEGLRRTAPPRRRASGSDSLLLFFAGALFTAIVALGMYAMKKSSPPQEVASKPAVATPRSVGRDRRPLSARPSASPGLIRPGGHPLAGRDRPFLFTEEPETPAADPMPDQPQPDQPSPDQPQPDAAASPDEPASPTQDGEEVPQSASPSSPPEPEPPPADDPDRLAKIENAVKQCLEALQRREFDSAERAIKGVEGIATQDPEAGRIAGWLQLVSYAKGFYHYRDKAIAAMKPGDEYDVKSKRIAVVEVTDTALTVKAAGQLMTWEFDAIPGAVTRSVVEAWFDDSPANHLYLGAYQFTRAKPDLEQARACWSKAMAGGADASLLMPLLTDAAVVDHDGAAAP